MLATRLYRLYIAGLVAAVSTFLPVWSNDTGHGRGCACTEDFTLSEAGLYLPAVVIAVMALVRLRRVDARGTSPLPRIWRVGYVLACVALSLVMLLDSTLQGVNAIVGTIAHATALTFALSLDGRSDEERQRG